VFIKVAENIKREAEQAFSVPVEEKQVATESNELLKAVIWSANKINNHLKIIHGPFSKTDSIPANAILNNRGYLFRFKETLLELFSEFKKRSFLAIKKLNFFNKDSHIKELINSFINDVGDLEKITNDIVEAITSYKDPDYSSNIVSLIDSFEEIELQVENFINDRIIDHIDTNILARNWMDNTDDNFDSTLVEEIPFVTQLLQEREKAFDGLFPEQGKDSNPLNPSDAQQMWYPGHLKDQRNFGEK
jgi:hypothetical protein